MLPAGEAPYRQPGVVEVVVVPARAVAVVQAAGQADAQHLDAPPPLQADPEAAAGGAPRRLDLVDVAHDRIEGPHAVHDVQPRIAGQGEDRVGQRRARKRGVDVPRALLAVAVARAVGHRQPQAAGKLLGDADLRIDAVRRPVGGVQPVERRAGLVDGDAAARERVRERRGRDRQLLLVPRPVVAYEPHVVAEVLEAHLRAGADDGVVEQPVLDVHGRVQPQVVDRVVGRLVPQPQPQAGPFAEPPVGLDEALDRGLGDVQLAVARGLRERGRRAGYLDRLAAAVHVGRGGAAGPRVVDDPPGRLAVHAGEPRREAVVVQAGEVERAVVVVLRQAVAPRVPRLQAGLQAPAAALPAHAVLDLDAGVLAEVAARPAPAVEGVRHVDGHPLGDRPGPRRVAAHAHPQVVHEPLAQPPLGDLEGPLVVAAVRAPLGQGEAADAVVLGTAALVVEPEAEGAPG